MMANNPAIGRRSSECCLMRKRNKFYLYILAKYLNKILANQNQKPNPFLSANEPKKQEGGPEILIESKSSKCKMKSTIFSYALFTKYNQLKFFK